MKKGIPVYDIGTFEAFKNSGILVSRFGNYAEHYKHLHAAHRHSFYHLVFFTKGSGIQHIDFKQHPVSPGLIYFMIPGQVHSWSFDGEVEGYLINFSKDYFGSFLLNPLYLQHFSFFDGFSADSVFMLPEPVQQKITGLFEGILKEGKDADPFKEDMVKIMMLSIFIEISRILDVKHPVQHNAYNQTILNNFKKLIDTHFLTLRFPKGYAELLYITPNHLNALSNDLLGMSAGQIIRDRIILEAKRMLVSKNLSVADIAHELAFKDQSYFIKFFKKQVGLTPDKFRKQIN